MVPAGLLRYRTAVACTVVRSVCIISAKLISMTESVNQQHNDLLPNEPVFDTKRGWGEGGGWVESPGLVLTLP